ncbi:hypothetical protein GCM10011490_19040 [Pseudoclavibacter endophyticus]|uniref:NAD-dependent epimerase/dehydratase family protein n=1 Tax=Pseudoclavibacter endophyticus TaxID=1778590 RepID=UPI001669DFC5|nr:NAD-dependent epimerase/dehydratase family protein [Pseudoclavibacter endophyticus]GGA68726.1 hypothetical protein GCM10011490_19040 [Pseudoclavibacter endophyticus]
MSAGSVLFIGGGGPTGQPVLNGLLHRGWNVTMLNSGRREIELDGEVERIAADPNFREPIEQAVAGRSFDLVIAQYGRLRHIADALAGRTERFIALGGMFYPGWIDPSATTRPTAETGSAKEWPIQYFDGAERPSESVPLEAIGGLGSRVVQTDTELRWRQLRGDFAVTLLRYPRVYGPRQPGAAEWSIVRRLLDGRDRIILPEAGLAAHSLLYAENAARIVLACVDQPELTSGRVFNCADDEPVTVRRWASMIAMAMGRDDVELVSAPADQAVSAWPYARFPTTIGHHMLDTTALDALRLSLIGTRTGITRTVDWFLDDPEERGRAVEPQLKDPFDYDTEDAILRILDRARADVAALGIAPPDMSHPYSHPKTTTTS